MTMEPTDQVEAVTVNSSDANYPLGESKPLPDDFVPSDSDVICGRARENFHHQGNSQFRDLVQRSMVPYLSARTKFEKSEAIAEVVDQIQAQSPGGGFIRKDTVTGKWYQIGEAKARDKVGHAIRKAVREVQENQARNRNSVNAVNRSFLAASINPVGLPPGSPTSLFGQDIGTSLQTLLESQAAAQTGLLLSDQQGSIFHSLLGARGIDTFSSMTALGGAALLEPFPSSNHPDALAAGYSSVGAGPRGTSDIPTSHHDDMATSLQRMAARGGGQQQSNRSQQQLDAMLFPHNFLAAAPTAADQLMRNAARVQQERRASFMAQRATGGIGSLDAAIRPSSRLHLLGDAQLPMSGEASHDTLLWANMRDISSAAAAGGAGRLGKPPRISKAKEERRKRRAKRMIDGSEDEEDDSDS